MTAEMIGGPDAPIELRRERSKAFAAAAVVPAGVAIRPASLGGVAVEWIEPRGSPTWPAFIHLHGGGYVMGDPAGSRTFTGELARRCGARVVSVDYGLAPAHPFPRAVDDAAAVYRALLAAGASPRALAIGGESAGGGLAVAALLAARDEGLPMPACAVVVSPWANLLCQSGAYADKSAADPLLTRAVLREMAALYLNGADGGQRCASPGLADLTGLPPMLVQVGSEEVLLGDSMELAERARHFGVEVELEVWEEMIHVWPMFHPMLPQAGEAIERVAGFLATQWAKREQEGED
ncbi:MAG: alpha/beta hydrolase fold domain-containing protein [Caulobacteraceae bacterium]